MRTAIASASARCSPRPAACAGLLRVGVGVAAQEALLERADAGVRRLGLLEGDLARSRRARIRPSIASTCASWPAAQRQEVAAGLRGQHRDPRRRPVLGRAPSSRGRPSRRRRAYPSSSRRSPSRPPARASPAARRRSRGPARARSSPSRPRPRSPSGRAAARRRRAASASARPTGRSRCESTSVSPWPGKCLAQAATPLVLEAPDHRRPEPAHELGIVAERAVADHGVLAGSCPRPRTGAKSQRMPQALSSSARASPMRRACSSEPRRPRARGGRPDRPRRLAGAPPARPPGRRPRAAAGRCPASRATLLQLAHQLGHLLRRGHVAREEDHVPDPEVADQRLHVGRGRRGRRSPTMNRWPAWRTCSPACRSATQPLAHRLVHPLAVGRLPAGRERGERGLHHLAHVLGRGGPGLAPPACSTAAAISSSVASGRQVRLEHDDLGPLLVGELRAAGLRVLLDRVLALLDEAPAAPCAASASSRAPCLSISLFMSAALAIRSTLVRAASWAFMAAVRSCVIRSTSVMVSRIPPLGLSGRPGPVIPQRPPATSRTQRS